METRNINLDKEKLVKATNSFVNQKLTNKFNLKLQVRRKRYRLLLIGSILFSVVMSVFMFLKSKEVNGLESIVQQHIAEMDFYKSPKLTTRGASDTREVDFLEIQKLISKENFSQAISLFQNTKENNFSNSQLMVIAQAYQKIGQFYESQIIVEKILVNQTILSQELNWLKALNLIQTENFGEAKNLMEPIILEKAYKWKEMKELIRLLPR